MPLALTVGAAMPVPLIRAMAFGRRLNIVETYWNTDNLTVMVKLPTLS